MIIGDGSFRKVFVVNESLPGPHIVVYAGQKIALKFINDLPNEATTIHFHGFHQTNTPWMDGAGHVSQCSISPGESFQYR